MLIGRKILGCVCVSQKTPRLPGQVKNSFSNRASISVRHRNFNFAMHCLKLATAPKRCLSALAIALISLDTQPRQL